MSRETSERVRDIPSLDDLLNRLQLNMRKYDELRTKLGELELDKYVIDSLLPQDLEAAAAEKLTGVAFLALDRLIIDRKASEIERQLKWLGGPDYTALNYTGHKAEVRALDPKSHRLAGIDTDTREYAGKDRDSRSGIIKQISLNPVDGGFVSLSNRFYTTEHQAAPLFDRGNDYQPLFDIKLL